jgi:hypothetical protein
MYLTFLDLDPLTLVKLLHGGLVLRFIVDFYYNQSWLKNDGRFKK